MSCPADAPGPLHCPTFRESFDATLRLLPRGRAWPANDGGGVAARFLAWLASVTTAPAPNDWPHGYVQTGFFAAVASVRNYLETRLCALRLEFWCATMSETRDMWMKEYGLPDPCDPFPDLCAKVAAIGGARCDYYAEIAARAGWSIQCLESHDDCGGRAGCAIADCFQTGQSLPLTVIEILVDTRKSPAYAVATRPPPQADCFFADHMLSCPVDLAPLACVLDRVVHAHVSIVYQTI